MIGIWLVTSNYRILYLAWEVIHPPIHVDIATNIEIALTVKAALTVQIGSCELLAQLEINLGYSEPLLKIKQQILIIALMIPYFQVQIQPQYLKFVHLMSYI